MIVSASYRTDIPAFYGAWFRARLAAGFCRVENPYGGPPGRVSLAPPEAEGFVFWTRNLAPFFPALEDVAALGLPFTVQFTITGYPRALDAATPDAEAALTQFRELARRFGSRAGVWRYDPVVFSSLTPPAWHRAAFARLAQALEGQSNEVVVSFAQIYRKTARGLGAAAREHGFSWRDPEAAEKQALLAELAEIAAGHGMRLALCAQPDLLIPGVAEARCIDAARLSEIAGRPLAALDKPHRKTCACHASRDIGAYDSCPQGCVYCYAASSRARARKRLAAHDPTGDFLIPPAQHA